MSSLKEWLEAQGASKPTIESAAVRIIGDAILDDSIVTSDIVRERISELSRRITITSNIADEQERKVNAMYKRLGEIHGELDEIDVALTEQTIKDPKVKDGIIAFAKVLETVRDTFGPKQMTPEVIIAAVQAASYCNWRAVMGPKWNGDN